jgi:hypothetical protein
MAVTPVPTLLSRLRLDPCHCWSPHEPGRKRQGRGEVAVPVQCNRPAGHDGNHMCLLGSYELLAEWGQATVVK